MKRYQAVYSRYYVRHVESYDDYADAVSTLQWGADGGELFALGIYDTQEGIMYLPDDPHLRVNTLGPATRELKLTEAPAVGGTFKRYPPDEGEGG
jgi:hypothetical protein